MPTIESPIFWPDAYKPGVAPVFVRNELTISASPERVWSALVEAGSWPSWYPNSHDVRIEGGAAVLSVGARFRWRTFGVSLVSRVAEFVPYERIAWEATSLGVHAYHAWLLSARDGGCHVLTEETQYGFLARLGDVLMPRRMARGHDLWLARLSARASR
jgi:uncharacterized protein YndB with AHSA1/START domain